MELVKIVDGQAKPYTLAAFRADNKHIVYGKGLSARTLEKQSVYYVRTLPKPEQLGKKAIAKDSPTQVSGEWVLGWDLVSLDANEARLLRNKLLDDCDWRFMSDQSPTDAWRTYRQSLRNLPAQSGFPASVTWPTEPT